jgi:hypothetical protein
LVRPRHFSLLSTGRLDQLDNFRHRETKLVSASGKALRVICSLVELGYSRCLLALAVGLARDRYVFLIEGGPNLRRCPFNGTRTSGGAARGEEGGHCSEREDTSWHDDLQV